MTEPIDMLGIYLHLARTSHQRRSMFARDRLLLLAGATAATMNLPEIAASCRQRILRHNPGHQVRHWPTIEEAMKDADFCHFVNRIGRRYPQERAERMLVDLGIEMARERDSYYSDTEYAAALLGPDAE